MPLKSVNKNVVILICHILIFFSCLSKKKKKKKLQKCCCCFSVQSAAIGMAGLIGHEPAWSLVHPSPPPSHHHNSKFGVIRKLRMSRFVLPVQILGVTMTYEYFY